MKNKDVKQPQEHSDAVRLLGERVSKTTNEILPPSPIVAFSGHIDKTWVYVTRGNRCFIRRYVKTPFPGTSGQTDQIDRQKSSQAKWTTLSEEERAGWQAFAVEHCFLDRSFRQTYNLGQNVFTHASKNRIAQGVQMTGTPPVHPPPKAPASIEEVPSPLPDAFAFAIGHGVADPDGYFIRFEMTPATETMRRTPHVRSYRWACPVPADNYLPLGPDGALYLLEGTRFSVEAGRRYGVKACIVTPDGLEGPKAEGHFIRLAWDESL